MAGRDLRQERESLGVEAQRADRGLVAISRPARMPYESNHRVTDFVKRFADVVLCTLGLLCASPIMIILAILVKLTSPGPVFYADLRLGLGGKSFRCYKFRTMLLNGDYILQRYLRDNPTARTDWATHKKIRGHDPRVTKVGMWLRRLSLDELPQLWNIIIGDMSLVGPRPYLEREATEMGTLRSVILSVRPGLTGLWQVSGRNNLSFRQRLRLEAWYVQHRTLWLDLLLLLRTVRVAITRHGAY